MLIRRKTLLMVNKSTRHSTVISGRTAFTHSSRSPVTETALRAKLRRGNVHSADWVVYCVDPIVKRYWSRFVLFWLRCDAAGKTVDGVTDGEVHSKTALKKGLFMNVTTVLPLSGRVGLPTETFLGSAGRPLCRSSGPETVKMARPPHNFGSPA